MVGVGEVEEQLLDRAVPGEQLGDLGVQVLAVHRDVARLPPPGVVVPEWVQTVERELRVVPVDERVVQPDAEAAPPEDLGERADQIPPPRRRGDREVGVRAVPQAEAFVVLRRHDDVPHPGVRGEVRPGTRVVQVRLEAVEVPAVLGVGHSFAVPHPLVACREGIQPPVDEHPEASLAHPADGLGAQSGVVHGTLGAGHLIAPLAMSPMNCRAPMRKTTRRGRTASRAPAMIIP
jgi:hypothetical protein